MGRINDFQELQVLSSGMSLPVKRTRMCAFQGVRNISFSENSFNVSFSENSFNFYHSLKNRGKMNKQ